MARNRMYRYLFAEQWCRYESQCRRFLGEDVCPEYPLIGNRVGLCWEDGLVIPLEAHRYHCHAGRIAALMLAEGPRPVGFDLDQGPFGELSVEDAVYRHGYEDFRLAAFCDGWIYTKPISECAGVTPIPGWINESNLERAGTQSPNPSFRQASVEEFNEGIARDAEIHRRWGHLR
jgi:hypothetical protein